MAYRREWLNAMGIRAPANCAIPTASVSASEARHHPQRPGTAKGFVFLSLEDETGVANAIVTPDLFHSEAVLLTSERF